MNYPHKGECPIERKAREVRQAMDKEEKEARKDRAYTQETREILDAFDHEYPNLKELPFLREAIPYLRDHLYDPHHDEEFQKHMHHALHSLPEQKWKSILDRCRQRLGISVDNVNGEEKDSTSPTK